MNTSKKQLAEQVIRFLSGGNTTNDEELDLRELILYVSQALASIVRIRYYQNKAEGDDYINGLFIYSFKNVLVQKDEDLNQYYAELPASTMDLPNDSAVHFVGYMQDQSKPIRRVPNGFIGISDGLSAGYLEGNSGFYVEGRNIYIVNIKKGEDPCKLLIKLVVAFGDIDEDKEIFMPLDVQDEIIAKAVQLYGVQKQSPKDVLNDNIK